MSRKSDRLSTDTCASRECRRARAGHKEALQSQLAITQIQVSFHSATAGTLYGVPQHAYIARRRVESAAEHESALLYKKRSGGARIESVILNEPCLHRSTFYRGDGRAGKINDKITF